MRKLLRWECQQAVTASPPDFSLSPLQLGMGRDAWRVAIASMLLCRTRRVQAEPALRDLLASYRCPPELGRAEYEDVQRITRSCGFAMQRSKQLVRMSSLWFENGWRDITDLPGCGVYVADAVGLFVFGETELESEDSVLTAYRDALHRAKLGAADVTEALIRDMQTEGQS